MLVEGLPHSSHPAQTRLLSVFIASRTFRKVAHKAGRGEGRAVRRAKPIRGPRPAQIQCVFHLELHGVVVRVNSFFGIIVG